MTALLYFGDDNSVRDIFVELTSSKGYYPIVCRDKEDLFCHIVFDRVLREKNLEKITIEPLVEEFKHIVKKIGLSLSNISEGDYKTSKIFKEYLKKDNVKKIDALIMDEMINCYWDETLQVIGDVSKDSVSSENLLKKVENIKQEQIHDLKKSISLVKFIRELGYNNPIIINNEYDNVGKYNVSSSFFNAGANVVVTGSDLFTNFEDHLNEAKKLNMAENAPAGIC